MIKVVIKNEKHLLKIFEEFILLFSIRFIADIIGG